MSQPVRRARRKIGRRGLVLSLFGLAWLLLGISNLLGPPVELEGFVLAEAVPWPVWYGVAVATGAAGVLGGALRSPAMDRLAFMAVVILPILFGLGWLWSWVTWLVSGGSYGAGYAVFVAAAWLAGTAIIFVVASWPEPRGY